MRALVGMMLALVAGLAMLAYPLMPVEQRTVTYHWDSAQGTMALPLSPYRPENFAITADCRALREHTGTVFSTVRGVDEGMRASGLELVVSAGRLGLDLRGERFDAGGLADCATTTIIFGTKAITIDQDGEQILAHPGDHRPAIDSLVPAGGVTGMRAVILADTQFDSSPTQAKLILGGVALALLVVALAVAVAGNRPRRRVRLSWRPGIDDVIVTLAIGFGIIAGGATDDDGFIAQIIRTPEMSGYIGNYVRWNNTPEAPFGWFYGPYAQWGEVSMEPVWLRLLPGILGLIAWVLLRHGLLPRLLPQPGRWPRIALISGFTLFWLVFCNSLRPEIFFALGTGMVLWCVLDALQRRSTTPLFLGALVAGLTIGTGPTGLLAIAPFVIAAPRLWRWFRPTGSAGLAVATTWLASLGAIVLVMFADQSWAAVASANRARTEFGPIYPIWEDYQRYWKLWWSFAARQFSVYLAVVALVVLAWQVRRWVPGTGLNRSVVRHVVGGAMALIVVMALGPTKLPHHFGALLLLGPLAMAAVTHLLVHTARTGIGLSPRRIALALGGSVVVLGLALHYNNTWWKLSTVGLLVDKNPLGIGPIPLWPAVVVAGLALGWWIIRRRLTRGALAYAIGLAVLSASQYANFAQAAIIRGPERYTMASAAITAITDDGCKLERSLYFEPDPSAGVLPDETESFTSADATGLRTWVADPTAADALSTGWYLIPADVRSGRWPLVIAVSGIDDGHRVIVEYDNGTRRTLAPTRKTLGTSALADIRLHPDAGIGRFRIHAESDGPAAANTRGEVIPFVIAQPRVPVTKPLLTLAERENVAVAWNLAFFAPCLDTPRQAHGRVEIADYILSDSEQPGNMSYHSRSGGPFAGVLGITEPSRVPIYAAGDYTESEISALDLIRLVPGVGGDLIDVELGTRIRGGLDRLPAIP